VSCSRRCGGVFAGANADHLRRGYGIAAFSRLAVREELANQTLVIIGFVPWTVRRAFSIVRIRHAALSWPAQEILKTLRTLRPSSYDVQSSA